MLDAKVKEMNAMQAKSDAQTRAFEAKEKKLTFVIALRPVTLNKLRATVAGLESQLLLARRCGLMPLISKMLPSCILRSDVLMCCAANRPKEPRARSKSSFYSTFVLL